MFLHIRCHTDLLKVAKWLKNHSYECFVVREQGDREHIHSYLQPKTPNGNPNIDSYRKQFKKEFPHLKGNKDFSMTVVKSPIGIQNYLCKGNKEGEVPDMLEASPEWDAERILKNHKEYWSRINTEENANTNAKSGSDSAVELILPPRVKVRQQSAVEKITSRIKKENSDWEEWSLNHISQKKIISAVARYFGDYGKGFDKFIINRLVNGVKLQLFPLEMEQIIEMSVGGPLDL